MIWIRNNPSISILGVSDCQLIKENFENTLNSFDRTFRGFIVKYAYVPEDYFEDEEIQKAISFLFYIDPLYIFPYTVKDYDEDFACYQRLAFRGHCRADVLVV